MKLFSIENLDPLMETEIRIYQVSPTGKIDTTILEPIDGSTGGSATSAMANIKKGYKVPATTEEVSAGVIELSVPTGSYVTNGVQRWDVNNISELLNVLTNNLNLAVYSFPGVGGLDRLLIVNRDVEMTRNFMIIIGQTVVLNLADLNNGKSAIVDTFRLGVALKETNPAPLVGERIHADLTGMDGDFIIEVNGNVYGQISTPEQLAISFNRDGNSETGICFEIVNDPTPPDPGPNPGGGGTSEFWVPPEAPNATYAIAGSNTGMVLRVIEENGGSKIQALPYGSMNNEFIDGPVVPAVSMSTLAINRGGNTIVSAGVGLGAPDNAYIVHQGNPPVEWPGRARQLPRILNNGKGVFAIVDGYAHIKFVTLDTTTTPGTTILGTEYQIPAPEGEYIDYIDLAPTGDFLIYTISHDNGVRMYAKEINGATGVSIADYTVTGPCADMLYTVNDDPFAYSRLLWFGEDMFIFATGLKNYVCTFDYDNQQIVTEEAAGEFVLMINGQVISTDLDNATMRIFSTSKNGPGSTMQYSVHEFNSTTKVFTPIVIDGALPYPINNRVENGAVSVNEGIIAWQGAIDWEGDAVDIRTHTYSFGPDGELIKAPYNDPSIIVTG